MDTMLVRLAAFDGTDFSKGAGFLKTTLWYFVNALMVRASWNPFMGNQDCIAPHVRGKDRKRTGDKE